MSLITARGMPSINKRLQIITSPCSSSVSSSIHLLHYVNISSRTSIPVTPDTVTESMTSCNLLFVLVRLPVAACQ